MRTLRRRILLDAFKLFDLALMVSSFLLATVLVSRDNRFSLQELISMRVKVGNFVLFFCFLVAWHLVLRGFGLYRSWRLWSRYGELANMLKATSLGTIVILAFTLVFRIALITPTFLFVFWASVSLAGVVSRVALRYFLQRVRAHGRNLRNMLIVGTNIRAVDLARKIEAKPYLGYRIIGFVDEPWAGIETFEATGYRLLADFTSLPGFLREQVVDEVVITLPVRSCHTHGSEIAALCEEQGITLRLLPNIFNFKIARPRGEELEDDYLITHRTGALEGGPVLVKRIIDIAVSLTAIMVLSPLLLVVAILIKLTSPGPVFFLQNRVGLNKRRFSICKFRTMVADAEHKIRELESLNEVSGPVFKIRNDPRITPLGKFLRRTSIDELPQLFNVLRGEMSLVGPRPLPVRDYEGFEQDWQRRRFSVVPGITCLWQVNGRSTISFEKWMQLDMQYIDQWSLWLDLKILVRTIPAVVKGSGAA
jgi:exopolysaccharide biosynthesis polyprenyl glycosylphosphotransferase